MFSFSWLDLNLVPQSLSLFPVYACLSLFPLSDQASWSRLCQSTTTTSINGFLFLFHQPLDVLTETKLWLSYCTTGIKTAPNNQRNSLNRAECYYTVSSPRVAINSKLTDHEWLELCSACLSHKVRPPYVTAAQQASRDKQRLLLPDQYLAR